MADRNDGELRTRAPAPATTSFRLPIRRVCGKQAAPTRPRRPRYRIGRISEKRGQMPIWTANNRELRARVPTFGTIS